MALTFIGWSSWEVKLALFEELSLPAPMAWLPKTGIAAARQQHQQQQVEIRLHPQRKLHAAAALASQRLGNLDMTLTVSRHMGSIVRVAV